jgi:hypothetical protein
MPNHTTNYVDVSVNSGCEKEQLALAELKTKLSIFDGKFDFNGIIPMPKELEKGAMIGFDNCPSDYEHSNMGCYVPKDRILRQRWRIDFGADNWYEWSYAHWGTKWNAYDVEIESNFDDELSLSFYSAWSPPVPIFAKMKEYCQEHNLNLSWDFCDEGEEYSVDLMDQDISKWGL